MRSGAGGLFVASMAGVFMGVLACSSSDQAANAPSDAGATGDGGGSSAPLRGSWTILGGPVLGVPSGLVPTALPRLASRQDRIWIAFRDRQDHLDVAELLPGASTPLGLSTTITTPNGPNIVTAPDGSLYVMSGDPAGTTTFARNLGGTWTTMSPPTGMQQPPCSGCFTLVGGVPHVVYRVANGSLVVTRFEGGAWSAGVPIPDSMPSATAFVSTTAIVEHEGKAVILHVMRGVDQHGKAHISTVSNGAVEPMGTTIPADLDEPRLATGPTGLYLSVVEPLSATTDPWQTTVYRWIGTAWDVAERSQPGERVVALAPTAKGIFATTSSPGVPQPTWNALRRLGSAPDAVPKGPAESPCGFASCVSDVELVATERGIALAFAGPAGIVAARFDLE